MDDDFNAQNGITVVYEFARLINVYSEQATVNHEQIARLAKQFAEMAAIFGIELATATEAPADEKIEALVTQPGLRAILKLATVCGIN